MAIVIQKAGIVTRIQDAGRNGVHHLGVPTNGAVDIRALALANYLVGKSPGTAGLEFTLTGGVIRFESQISFALAGADVHCTLNNNPIPCYEQIVANTHDVLGIFPFSQGCRLYFDLAISDYLQAKNVLGSLSTYVQADLSDSKVAILRMVM